jgi:hypothetical protein
MFLEFDLKFSALQYPKKRKEFPSLRSLGLREEGQRARVQKCKGLLSPRNAREHDAKTEEAARVVEREPEAIGRTAANRVVVPRPTAQHPVYIITFICPRTTICRRTFIIEIPYILTPLPYIPMHIM